MEDTIAAIATARAPSAIGIIRISGSTAIETAAFVFKPACGKSLSEADNRKMTYGVLLDRTGSVIDHVLAVVTRGPSSYTGEDCVELHCHGSLIILTEGLSSLFAHGARQARAGEFTKRAFLNGRMDLVQAEAVVDLIEAETAEAAQNAAGQLGGAISGKVEEIYGELLEMVSQFQAVIDYPDEDIDPLERPKIAQSIERTAEVLRALLKSCEKGKIIRNGIKSVILGRPNTGKSSLLNAFLGYDRSIVTPVAGTTRDRIEESVKLGGVLLRLSDTAGIRETLDPVEKIGVSLARAAAEEAELSFAVLDGSEPLTAEDIDAMEQALATKRSIAVINKSDLPQRIDRFEVERRFLNVCEISALTHAGLEQVDDMIHTIFERETVVCNGELLTNARQADAVSRALEALEAADESICSGQTPDVVLTDVEVAMDALGEITGRTVREDIVARIFERFCVGK